MSEFTVSYSRRIGDVEKTWTARSTERWALGYLLAEVIRETEGRDSTHVEPEPAPTPVAA